ncbi:unnamed protein product [Miscanthus lutarioriparius]|uniref:Uncharacterized protein n=1 Tax=Miscanthus lutarioriparius TaxID=422564 RepID=A0A811PY10_9POAL|nr:unnamed protein product [Miscanthus lutarioriparius]
MEPANQGSGGGAASHDLFSEICSIHSEVSPWFAFNVVVCKSIIEQFIGSSIAYRLEDRRMLCYFFDFKHKCVHVIDPIYNKDQSLIFEQLHHPNVSKAVSVCNRIEMFFENWHHKMQDWNINFVQPTVMDPTSDETGLLTLLYIREFDGCKIRNSNRLILMADTFGEYDSNITDTLWPSGGKHSNKDSFSLSGQHSLFGSKKRALLDSIGFRGLLKVHNQCLQCRNLILSLLSCMDPNTGTIVHKSELTVTDRDVNLVLGIPYRGEDVYLRTRCTRIVDSMKGALLPDSDCDLNMEAVPEILLKDSGRKMNIKERQVFYLDNLNFGFMTPRHDILPRISKYTPRLVSELLSFGRGSNMSYKTLRFGQCKMYQKV